MTQSVPALLDVELILDAKASTGESPTWSAGEQVLYWIDIEKPALHRFDPRTGEDQHWEMPSEIGSFALCQSGHVLAALRTGSARVETGRGAYELLGAAPYNPLTHRFNGGKCDARGRYWIGTMHKPLFRAEHTATTDEAGRHELAKPIHVFSQTNGLKPLGLRAVIANGFAWSPDHRTMYLTDSDAGIIHAFDFDLESGEPSHPRVLAQFEPGQGKPDGAAVDAEGRYWCALYGGGRVVRLGRDGNIDREVALPVSQPTMCAFGGSDLETLFITSAANGLDSEAREREPHAGGLFRCSPGVRGQAPVLFADGAGP